MNETVDPQNGSAEVVRGWTVVQTSLNDEDLERLAAEIVEAYSPTQEEFDNGDRVQVVIRADITTGDIRLVIPLFAPDQGAVDSMVAEIGSKIKAADPKASVTFARVEQHIPVPATRTPAYVTEDEAYNPPQGYHPDGVNAWG